MSISNGFDYSTFDPETRRRAVNARRRFLGVWTAVGAILLLAVVVYLLNVLSTPVGVVIWATIIVFCLRGIVNGLEKHGVNRGLGTAIAYVVMIVVLGVVFFLMFSPIFGFGDQFANLVESIPGYVQSTIDWGNSLYERYASVLENESVRQGINDVLSSLGAWATNFASESATSAIGIGAGIANSLVAVGFGLVVAFWVLMELPALGRECKRLVGPKRQEDLEMLHVTFTRVMGGYIKATLVQCAIIGVGCGMCFAIVGIPNYAALGVIAGILNIVPVVGPWLGGALAAVVGVFVSPLAAVVALLGTIAIQQIVYTFVSPKIMSNSVDVHPALTLVALLAGSAIGGAMSGLIGSVFGMLVAIPAVAVAKAVFVYYFEKRTGRRLVAADGVFFKGAPSEGDAVDPLADVAAPHPDSTGSMERIQARKERAQRLARHRRKR
ncbi:MAG: AI-2E family transporter [Eggerthellaceae bacterium]|nr:AI-2E family transporter [Eggerthellaceae bacterium]